MMIFWYHSLTCVCPRCLDLDVGLDEAGRQGLQVEIKTRRFHA